MDLDPPGLVRPPDAKSDRNSAALELGTEARNYVGIGRASARRRCGSRPGSPPRPPRPIYAVRTTGRRRRARSCLCAPLTLRTNRRNSGPGSAVFCSAGKAASSDPTSPLSLPDTGSHVAPISVMPAPTPSPKAGLEPDDCACRPVRQSRDTPRLGARAAAAHLFKVALCHDCGYDAGRGRYGNEALADRLIRAGQQAVRRCRSHRQSRRPTEPPNLFPVGRQTTATNRPT